RPSELSGGMRQRVALARALAMDPSVLLLDEPLGALDALTRANLQEEIARIWSENKKTVILITNDVDEGIMLADRVIPLTRGPGATLGPSIQVNLARPRNRKTLNHDEAFKLLRQRVIDFLMKKSHSKHTATIRKTFVLPNILPDDLDAPRTFQFGKSNSVRREELKHERLEVEI
ncbi:MAG TPA: nitrate ABC transporter ATP-binding protein, partial [Verrucomicrobiales bacterium]|nr:nitrate ABC transporter ATP-binding protein [Verrucomicrobiales bacterium]